MESHDLNLLAKKIKRWERHGDLVLVGDHLLPQHLSEKDADHLCQLLRCKRLAKYSKISTDGYRSPLVQLIKGDDPWVEHVDNRITYTFDITKCMFSFGNINEKLRVSRFECSGETVADLFCGIGYFTLPLLVHSKADLVHACDWNPHAIEALNRNLKRNKVADKCVVHFGDNRSECPKGVCDRVYLGLIPSSRGSWRTACAALKPTSGGMLHIHENVSTFGTKGKEAKIEAQSNWKQQVVSELEDIFKQLYPQTPWLVKAVQVIKVKSYAPHINHVVFDVDCRPQFVSL